MLFQKLRTKKQKKRPGVRLTGRKSKIAAKVSRLDPSSKKAAFVFKGVFHIATLISDFDLRLSFFGRKINASSDHLTDMFSKVATYSEEISVSTTQIVSANTELSEVIGRISDDAELLNRNTAQSNEILKCIEEENTEMLVFSKDMTQSVGDLLSVIDKINEAVKGITKISDQTKLLSLNASIEAARAGMAGKGFAVVADEIRDLSETTKKMTLRIDELLTEMNSASNKSKSSVDKTIDSIGRVSGSIETVSGVMADSAAATESITSRIAEAAETSRGISGSLQESSAALESVNNDIQSLSRSAEDLKNISSAIHEISASIGNIEDNVNQLALTSGEMVNSKLCGLSNDDFIETVEKAIKAHGAWMNNVKNMAKNMTVIPIQTDEHKCGFGHFYYAVKPASDKLTVLWDSVEALHHDLHKTGDLIISHIEQNNAGQAMSAANEAEQISGVIFEKFKQMIQLAKDMSHKKEFVF